MWTHPARWVWSLPLCVIGVWNMNWPSTLSMVVIVVCDGCLKCEFAQHAEYGRYRCVWLMFEMWTRPTRWVWLLSMCVLCVWSVNSRSTLSRVVIIVCDWCLKFELAQHAEYGRYRCVWLVFEVWTHPVHSSGSLSLCVIGVWNVNSPSTPSMVVIVVCDWCLKCELAQHTEYGRCRCVCLVFEIWTGPAHWVWSLSLCVLGVWNMNWPSTLSMVVIVMCVGVWNVTSVSTLSMVVIVVCDWCLICELTQHAEYGCYRCVCWCLKCELAQHAEYGRYRCVWLVFEVWTRPARWVWSLSLCVIGVWNMNWPSTLSMVVIVVCDWCLICELTQHAEYCCYRCVCWCLKCELAQHAEYGRYRCVWLVFEVWTYPARWVWSLSLCVIGVWNVNSPGTLSMIVITVCDWCLKYELAQHAEYSCYRYVWLVFEMWTRPARWVW